jgi:hypothetical protein
MPPEISQPLRQLAALLRAPLLGEAPSAVAIDAQIAEFGIRRHRVGPLLYAAQKTGNLDADAAVLARLAQQYRTNVLRIAMTDGFLRDLAGKFLAAQIPWLAFKGVPLARQLYPDPAWRHAHDVDVLVPAALHARASHLLLGDGLKIVNTRLRPDHWLERASAAIAKDVMFRQPKMGIDMELHRRLFFGRDEENAVPLLRETFRPRLGQTPTDIPVAPAGAGSVFYLLLHGASSRWFRLKWLVDLLPLTRQIDETAVDAIAVAARQMGAETTVKAGLLLLDWVFGDVTAGPLRLWLKEGAGQGVIEARARAYLDALDLSAASQANREGDRFDSLNMYYSMLDSRRYRAAVILRGGAWVALRALANSVPKRTSAPIATPPIAE